MSKWVGYAVSVNCGEPLGCYQGTILDADGTTITLTKAFRNGFPYPKSQVTLNAADIKDLKIIEARSEPHEQTHSTVAVCKSGKKAQRATVCENLQANPSSSGNQPSQVQTGSNNKPGNGRSSNGNGQTPGRSKPIDIQGMRPGKNNNTDRLHGSYGPTGSTPKSRGAAGAGGPAHEKARRRNEACFGDEADPSLDTDFDFEGNLALFDKRALWEQMNSHKPDLVRQTDEAGKFRHDENVLGGGVTVTARARRGIRVPDELRGALDYVTDDGVCVPALTARARHQLWEAVARAGLAECSRVLLARAAADVCVRLVGGCRRLEARNAHQTPTVVVLCGRHSAGAAALTAARILHSHTAVVHCYLHPNTCGGGGGGGGGGSAVDSDAQSSIGRELSALALCDIAVWDRLDMLPKPDLILLALQSPHSYAGEDTYSACMSWSRSARAACVALEPPETGLGISCRAAVLGLLPSALPNCLGRVYLADLAPPPRLFADMRIVYRPPFGAASTLALHPADE